MTLEAFSRLPLENAWIWVSLTGEITTSEFALVRLSIPAMSSLEHEVNMVVPNNTVAATT